MKISTATNILCERANSSPVPMQESIVSCARAGFTQLDFGFAELAFNSQAFRGNDWKKDIETYAELARQNNIKFVQGHASIFDFCIKSDNYTQQQELFYRSFYGAQMLGIPWLVVHPSTLIVDGKMSPDTHRLNIEFFKELSSFARSLGVGIAIENMWGYACPGVARYAISASEMLKLVEDIDCDNVGVCWDVEHASVENLPQGESIQMLGNHIKVTHISDETDRNNIHVLPYTGNVHWNAILEAFADINYNGTFSLEIQHFLPAMPRELCQEAICFAYKIGSYLVEQLELKKAVNKAIMQKEDLVL